MGNDDAITETALEELFNLAEKFQADVVHCEKCFVTDSTEKIPDTKNLQTSFYNVKEFVTKPTLITENFFERAQDLYNNFFDWNTWTKFIRRDYFVENQIKFPHVGSEDLWCVCQLVCSAKRWLRVPNVTYIYRILADSLSHKKRTPEENFRETLRSLDVGIGLLDEFLSERKFFAENPDAKYFVFGAVVNRHLIFMLNYYTQFSAASFDELFRAEFARMKNYPALSAFLFSRMNLFQINLMQLQQQIQTK